MGVTLAHVTLRKFFKSSAASCAESVCCWGSMASFEEKVEAFLDNYDKLKSVENEEAFLKQFMVRSNSVCVSVFRDSVLSFCTHVLGCFVAVQCTEVHVCRIVRC